MKRLMKLNGALSALALVLGLGLSAPALADLDTEWGVYDADDNGILSNEEFGDGLFDSWDADDDNRIAADEFGENDLLGDVEFGAYDDNGDGYWDETEFQEVYEGSGLYERYRNADAGGIRPEEFATFYDDAGDAGLFDV